ncbi:hypothetical protein FQN55_006699 [Onygenales sp. PD_40]|nr:hypothetical protein FQN55_006699 [Onygenales sp. PD_40]
MVYSGASSPVSDLDDRRGSQRQPVDSIYSTSSDAPQHTSLPYSHAPTPVDRGMELSPISRVSSRQTYAADQKASAVRYNDIAERIQYADRKDAQRKDNFPNWRPHWVRRGPFWIFVSAIILIVLYAALCGISKTRGYIAVSSPGVDVIFKFGPVFFALIIAIMVDRLAEDMKTLQPYIALASGTDNSLRAQYGARITEPTTGAWLASFIPSPNPLQLFLPEKFRKWFGLATLWCAFVLVPLQTGLLTKGMWAKTTATEQFDVLGVPELMNAAYRSGFPEQAIDAIYHGQNVSDFKWIALMEKQTNTEAGWAAVMPFRPFSSEEQLPSGVVHWKGRTSAVWSYLECSQANELSITATAIDVDGEKRSATDVELKVQDVNGCSRTWNWDAISNADAATMQSPLLSDGTFALWDKACSDFAYMVISGPLAIQSANDFTADASAPSEWGAISCQAHYMATINGIFYDVQAVGQGNPTYEEASDAAITNVTIPPWGKEEPLHSLMTPMQNVVLNSSLLYEISSPTDRRTFWNQHKNNTFDAYMPGSNLRYTCAEINSPSASKFSWNNSQSCAMYLVASDIWSFLVATTAASVALYVPIERWDTTSATITLARESWILSEFAVLYTLLLYTAVIFLLAMDRSLEFGLGRRARGRPTGLHGSGSSIAGLAAVFQDLETRKLWEGVDLMNKKEALDRHQAMMCRTTLLLRQWRRSAYGDKAVARPVKHRKHEYATIHSGSELPRSRENLRRLRYGGVPVLAYVAIGGLLCTAVLIWVVLSYLIRTDKTSFRMWHQQLGSSTFSQDGVKAQIQQLLFSGLPTLVLSLITSWWTEVDRFVRLTQPYKALASGDVGRNTVLLDYMHEWNWKIPFRAFRNRHWKLSYVTAITFILRIGTLFWAGIFDMGNGIAGNGETAHLLQEWRQDSFPADMSKTFSDEMRAIALSRAIYGYPQMPGWQSGAYQFPAVKLPENNNYNVSLTGLTGVLDCSAVTVDARVSDESGWRATIREGECTGAIWDSACTIPQDISGEAASSGTTGATRCMAWRYLNENNCPDIPSQGAGRWWILGLSGPMSATQSTLTGGSTTPIALLCTPKFSFDTMMVGITTASGSSLPTLTLSQPTHRENISTDHWKNDDGKTFAAYASELMNNTLAGNLQTISSTTYLDLLSSIGALNGTSRIDALFNTSTLATSISHTFSAVFATMAGLPQDGPLSSFLLTPVADDSTSPTVEALPQEQVAYLNKGPLWVGFIVLCIFAISIPWAWPEKRRRTPMDVGYAANVLALVYDSRLMDIVSRDGWRWELENKRFRIGIFQGLSGSERLGIDVVDVVAEVK